MATTRLEVYRPLRASLRTPRVRFWPLLAAGVRTAAKRRLPLVLLYAVPAIATVIFSFFVYAKFAAESAVLPEVLGGGVGFAEILAKQALDRLEVRRQIIGFHTQMNAFTFLVTVWYGSGLLCDDRRVGAHQLWFSRPLTRLDYFLGKLFTAGFFGLVASLVPVLVIFTVASFASPNWSFLREQWDILPRAVVFSAIWVTFVASLTLLASSLAPRKAFALVGIFAVFGLSTATGGFLGEFVDESLYAFALPLNIQSVAHAVFGREENWLLVPKTTGFAVILSSTAVFLAWTLFRVRRLEVVE